MQGMTILQGKCPVLFDGYSELAALKGGELDDWDYRAYPVRFQNHYRIMIEVFDEEGEFIAFWH